MEDLSDNILLIRYLEGDLSPSDKLQVQTRLGKESKLKAELESMQEMYASFDQVQSASVPASVDQNFYRLLGQVEKEEVESPLRSISTNWKWMAIAASVLMLIALSISLQQNWSQQHQMASLQAEIEKTQRMLILSMLENPSASNRMQAVGVSLQRIERDDEILTALQQVLDYDPNVNVRLKAATSLSTFIEEPKVINILVSSLAKQSYPQVQIALIEILTEARKKEALGALHQLLEQEGLMEIVKDKAAEGIGILL